MPHYDNFNLIVCKTGWVDQDLVNYDWQSDVLWSIDSEISFGVDE